MVPVPIVVQYRVRGVAREARLVAGRPSHHTQWQRGLGWVWQDRHRHLVGPIPGCVLFRPHPPCIPRDQAAGAFRCPTPHHTALRALSKPD